MPTDDVIGLLLCVPLFYFMVRITRWMNAPFGSGAESPVDVTAGVARIHAYHADRLAKRTCRCCGESWCGMPMEPKAAPPCCLVCAAHNGRFYDDDGKRTP